MAKHRSPAYPVVDLGTALSRVQTLYDADRRNKIPVDVAVEHLGYKKSSGLGLRAIAALRQFGLLDAAGRKGDRQVWLSARALDIILAPEEDDSQRLQAIQEAALAPPIHLELWEHIQGVIPSDATLRSHLIREMNFNDNYVGKFIEQFRDTVVFSRLSDGDTIKGNEFEEECEQSRGGETPLNQKNPKGENMLDLPVTLPSLKIVTVNIPADMTKLDFECFLNMIKSWEPALVRDAPEPNIEGDAPSD